MAFSFDAAKAFARIQTTVARRILDGLRAIAGDPFGLHAAAKALAGSKDALRLRVGDWRVPYRVERAVKRVYVEDVLNREDACR